MNLKNLISVMVLTALSFSIFMLSMIGAHALDSIDENVPDPTFTDIPYGSGYYFSTWYLYSDGAVNGYDDGSFRPDQSINRAEFLRIVMDAAYIEVEGGDCYSDVRDEWFAPYVCTATDLGHVVGDAGTNNFRPGDSVNFAEASKIVANVMGVDVLQIDPKEGEELPWYAVYVMSLEDEGAIPASVDSFDHQVTRGEMAEMIYRISAGVEDEASNTYSNIEKGKSIFDPKFAAYGEGLQTFASCEDFSAYFTAYGPTGDFGGGFEDDVFVIEESSEDVGSAAKSVANVEYSDTNVQVEGVDEADIVKTDGEYIYVLKKGTVRIVKAYQPDQMEELAQIDFDSGELNWMWANDMYVDDDSLVIVASGSGDIDYGIDAVADEPELVDYYWNDEDITEVYIYDISDKNSPELERKVSFEGSYLSSRKVDDTVYLVANKYVWAWQGDDFIPLERDGDVVKEIAGCDEVYYDPESRSTDFIVVAAVPVDDAKKSVDKEVILGSSSSIYASRNNLYVADMTYNWWWGYDLEEETKIHKFSLDGNEIEHEADGSVPGTILNQFSMDEHEGDFRIATTIGNVWNGDALNNVYILNGDLERVSEIEGIAPGERIYSTRFMEDRLYMVTFKKVDPFFVIDLDDRTNPQILGELKIPGYSNYLHPLDEDHVIGFGKDTVDPSDLEAEDFWGAVDFAWFQGMKMAIFDVTDVQNPVELHKEIIGDRGTSSELLWNHKALMFDANKGIIAFPVLLAELPETVSKDPDVPQSAYGQYTYQGAYVYDVNVEDGFELRGTISHYDEGQLNDAFSYYYFGEEDIDRILYIGDYLYTISQALVRASNLEDLEFVNEVELN